MQEDERIYLVEADVRARPTIFAANAYYLFCAISIIVMAVAYAVISYVVAPSKIKLWYFILSSVVEVAAFALPPIFYAAKNPEKLPAFRLTLPSGAMVALAGVLAVLGYFLSSIIGNLWMLVVERFGGTLTTNTMLIPKSGSELMMLIFVVGVLPGVCEELMFRGMMLGAWEARGSKVALMVTSVLFAVLHASVLGFPSQFAVALVLGMLALSTGSLYPGIIFHVLYNSLCIAVPYLVPASGEAPAGMTLYEYIGGLAGVLQLGMLLALFLGLMAGVLAAVYRIGSKKRVIFEKPSVRDKRPGEWLVLMAGLLTVLLLWVLNFATVFGAKI